MDIFTTAFVPSGSRWPLHTVAFGAATLMLNLLVTTCNAQLPPDQSPTAPELAEIESWLNSEGFQLGDLKGKVTILHFWTYGCINCKRNLPTYNKWYREFPKERVQMVGIHTPEFPREKDLPTIAAQVKQLGIEYPVAIDNQGATWRAYENRYWPCIYLIDKQGKVRYRWEGELEYQDAGGTAKVRAIVKKLVAEK